MTAFLTSGTAAQPRSQHGTICVVPSVRGMSPAVLFATDGSAHATELMSAVQRRPLESGCRANAALMPRMCACTCTCQSAEGWGHMNVQYSTSYDKLVEHPGLP